MASSTFRTFEMPRTTVSRTIGFTPFPARGVCPTINRNGGHALSRSIWGNSISRPRGGGQGSGIRGRGSGVRGQERELEIEIDIMKVDPVDSVDDRETT